MLREGWGHVDARSVLQPFVFLSSWTRLRLASGVVALLGLLSYVALASRAPGAALLVASFLLFLAVLGGVLTVLPADRKITFERQLEVVAYRLGTAILVYFVIGYALLWTLNTLAPVDAQVPIAWDGPFLRPWENTFFRRVTFWPFYVLLILGCQALLPTPPGAC